ncbi:DUF6025 family protein [Kitasatospora sp. NPDC052896]|uniref:DUF6025 family protein n=1 Tax=Kitasatospora sp. NPDC052896 TaxID=3364061 RepID=UPI0037C9F7AB
MTESTTTAAAGIGHALADAIGTGSGGRELRQALARLESGGRQLDWIHLGKCDIAMRDLIAIVRDSGLTPPRTGHLGDWSDIDAGRSGLLDYNRTICGVLGVGSPLLFDTTSTETTALDAGDTIYLPGSVVDRGVAHQLPLLVHTADGLRSADRTKSWFSPFVMVDADGDRKLLSQYHRERNARLGLAPDYVSSRMVAGADRLRTLLDTALLATEGNSRGKVLLGSLFAGLVGTDGAPRDGEVLFDGPGYRVGAELLTRQELVERLLLPFVVINDEQARQRHLDGPTPTVVPMLSNLFLTMLMAQLRTHVADPTVAVDGIDAHLHWGAIGMAGFPPRKRGYFEGGEYPRRLRPFFDHAAAHAGTAATLFIVAPSVVFTLLPRRSQGTDVELVAQLCGQVRDATKEVTNADRAAEAVQRVVEDWYARHGEELSHFYRSQFNGKRTISGQTPPPTDPEVVVGEEFLDLTCRQASLIVGAMQDLNKA